MFSLKGLFPRQQSIGSAQQTIQRTTGYRSACFWKSQCRRQV